MARKKENRGGAREGAGREKIDPLDKKYPITLHVEWRYISGDTRLPQSHKIDLMDKAMQKTFKKVTDKNNL